jgi:hypothetical protein
MNFSRPNFVNSTYIVGYRCAEIYGDLLRKLMGEYLANGGEMVESKRNRHLVQPSVFSGPSCWVPRTLVQE